MARLFGNDDDNRLTGTGVADLIYGRSGDDRLYGLGGNDTIDASDGDDTVNGGAGNDSLNGGDGFDQLAGGDGNDTLNGVVRPNGFNPGEAAVDTMIGGLGDDAYFVDNAGDVLSDAGGIDTVVAFDMDWTLGAGFDLLRLAATFASVQTLLPALLLVIVGEVARIRSALYYVIGGGATLAVVPLMARLGEPLTVLDLSPVVWQVLATAGFAGGFVYWLLAGRNA